MRTRTRLGLLATVGLATAIGISNCNRQDKYIDSPPPIPKKTISPTSAPEFYTDTRRWTYELNAYYGDKVPQRAYYKIKTDLMGEEDRGGVSSPMCMFDKPGFNLYVLTNLETEETKKADRNSNSTKLWEGWHDFMANESGYEWDETNGTWLGTAKSIKIEETEEFKSELSMWITKIDEFFLEKFDEGKTILFKPPLIAKK